MGFPNSSHGFYPSHGFWRCWYLPTISRLALCHGVACDSHYMRGYALASRPPTIRPLRHQWMEDRPLQLLPHRRSHYLCVGVVSPRCRTLLELLHVANMDCSLQRCRQPDL
ncbi:hypothetical protein E4U60_002889, partial [Claviceps pazoutovae]